MVQPVNPQVGDILYLMATVERVEGLTTAQLSRLSLGSAALVHGDLPAALAGFDTVLGAPELTERTRDQVAALRQLTAALIGEVPGRPSAADGPGLRAVHLCLQADQHWRAGELAEALWHNQLAESAAADAGPVWHVYTRLMTAKRLVDMRITGRATDLVAQVRSDQDRYGLYAFESIPTALAAALCLQRDEPAAALRTAADAIECARMHRTTVAVPRALAVAALAHLRLGEPSRAGEKLERMREQPHHYVLPDAVARAALIDIEVTAERSGVTAAASLIRLSWTSIEAEPASFVEDPAMPAYLTATSLRAGDFDSAQRIVEATEVLAWQNPGVPLLRDAASCARATYDGDTAAFASLLDSATDPYLRRRLSTARATGRSRAGDRSSRSGHSSTGDTKAGAGGPEQRLGHFTMAGLTDRECQVAGLVGQGMTNRLVAREIGITEHTVNFHLRKIYRKFDISSRAELICRIADSR